MAMPRVDGAEAAVGLKHPQLVVVGYPTPDWNVSEKCGCSGADFDHQQAVFFTHDRGIEQDRALLDHYSNRTAWLLTFDPATGQEKITPYPEARAQQ